MAKAGAARAISPASASPISARPRSSGTAPPAGRSTMPSSGRIAAPPMPVRRCGRPATSAMSRRAPGCCSIRISRPPRSPGCSITSTARARRRERAARVRHGRQLPALAAHRRPGARDRRHQRGAHAAARHPHRANGTTTSAGCSACRTTLLPQVRDCAGDFGTTCPTCSAGRSAFSASPATSRRRRWGRAASRPA